MIVRTEQLTKRFGSTLALAALDLGSEEREAHDMTVWREVDSHRDKVVKMGGDGVLATSDGPGRAIDCARSLHSELAAIDIDVRVGLHAGEIEQRDGDIGGLAVHIAARICGLANANEILVSPTLPGLVAGAGFEFTERGEHKLKGVPGEWRLFAVDRTSER